MIVGAALKLRQQNFVINGEAVVLSPNGVSDFAALHSGRHNEQAQLYALDMLASGGDDYRRLQLSQHKNLAGCSMVASTPFSSPSMRKARLAAIYFASRATWTRGHCLNRLDRAFGAGKCHHWIKVKNSAHPAHSRVRDAPTRARQVHS
jgi:bifunctional non-homologous end joining protein LigD